jgi:single-stranded-DNA-specific exonuclease
MTASGIGSREVTSSDIGFGMGPRLNAMGRMGSADTALKLLLSRSKLEADNIAGMLNRENSSRQRTEAKILEEALARVERDVNFKDQRVIVLAGEGWHPGVIGIVASRIQERFYRPTIMIALEGQVGKGSGRSIANFDLFAALNHTNEFLVDYGGHEGACGLVVKKDNIAMFIERINAYAREKLTESDLFPSLEIDTVADMPEIDEKLVREIALLNPYGPDNPKPLFLTEGLIVGSEPRYLSKNGIKLWVKKSGRAFEAISFKRDTLEMPVPGKPFDMVYTPSINSWQGMETVQLDIKDIRVERG